MDASSILFELKLAKSLHHYSRAPTETLNTKADSSELLHGSHQGIHHALCPLPPKQSAPGADVLPRLRPRLGKDEGCVQGSAAAAAAQMQSRDSQDMHRHNLSPGSASTVRSRGGQLDSWTAAGPLPRNSCTAAFSQQGYQSLFGSTTISTREAIYKLHAAHVDTVPACARCSSMPLPDSRLGKCWADPRLRVSTPAARRKLSFKLAPDQVTTHPLPAPPQIRCRPLILPMPVSCLAASIISLVPCPSSLVPALFARCAPSLAHFVCPVHAPFMLRSCSFRISPPPPPHIHTRQLCAQR